MEMKQLKCRVHGGYFSVPRKAGRPATKCNDSNICDGHPVYADEPSGDVPTKRRRKPSRAAGRKMADLPEVPQEPAPTKGGRITLPSYKVRAKTTPQNRRRRAEKVEEAPEPKKPRPTLRGVNRAGLRTGTKCSCDEFQGLDRNHEKGIEGCKYAARKSPAVVKHNPSVPLAFQAKKLLEPEGWKVKGRQEFDEDGHGVAVVIGSRGKEIITLTWVNGKLESQHYAMFAGDKPELAGMPRPKLNFNPDDMSDVALIKEISGKKITWWNRTGNNRETAILPSRSDQRVKVEHLMNGSGDEEKRIITFVDQSGSGYRSFDLQTLIRVQ